MRRRGIALPLARHFTFRIPHSAFARRSGAQHVQVGEELELEAGGDFVGFEFFGAALVVHDDGEGFAGERVAVEVHAVNAAAQGEGIAVGEGEAQCGQGGVRAEAEGEFHGDRVEGVVGHPTDEGGEESLRAGDEGARGEAPGFVRAEDGELGAGEEVFADAGGEG